MIYVDLNEERVRRLSFYLAMEEWVARNMSEPECFFMWQVEPSVIFGRNQDVYSEVNLDYCRQNGIQVYRRKSGGGCVYADLSNVMLAYITTADEAQTTFDHYLKMVVEVLKKMGIAASWTEHNDIMIGDRKVSGNAFYHVTTSFPDTPTADGVKAAPSKAVGKDIVHDACSTIQTCATWSSHHTVRREDAQARCAKRKTTDMSAKGPHHTHPAGGESIHPRHLTDSSVTLTPKEVTEIEKLEQEYLSSEWIFGHNPKH